MLLLLSLAFATDRVEGAETLAVGSTAVANPWSNSAISVNPAVLSTIPRYQFGFSGSYSGRGLHWNISAADSKTTDYFAFGLTYSGDRYNPPLRISELPGWTVPDQVLTNYRRNQDVGFALSIPLFQRHLAFGMGGSLSFYDHERQGKGNTGNLTAGLAARASDHLFFGLSGRNLLPTNNPSADRPLELLAGAHLSDPSIGSLSIEGGARPNNTEGPLVMAAGGEIRLAEGSVLRTGWRLQDAAHAVTLGFGAGTQEAGVDLGFALPTTSLLKPADWAVQLSIRIEGPDPSKINPD